ncbi:hypothetical protein IWQ60_011484 [Tieghemiomyces parasiticus]|uniref:Proteasome assembly chaperone 3 n=1 Tax=Tieghemiomyces parasiticus TaxID=78921 RepID=A0A9W7ZN49_9FUNG|nr:hypothetical protein IWQ60_011484 [Tieghemiomyces parasiticus]
MAEPAFPVNIRQTCLEVQGHPTDVVLLGFADKIVVLITQLGNVGSLLASGGGDRTTDMAGHPRTVDDDDFGGSSAPPTHTQFLLGNTSDSGLNVVYQLFASEVTHLIHQQSPQDARALLLGISLKDHREYSGDGAPSSGNVAGVLRPVLDAVAGLRVW